MQYGPHGPDSWHIPPDGDVLDSSKAAGFANQRRRPLHWASVSLFAIASLILLIVGGIYAFTTSFSSFAFCDDEGFVMLAVRDYLNGNPLYDAVVSRYGPVYFVYEWLLHSLCSMQVTHDTTRMFFILHWLSAAAVLAVAGGVMARSVLLGFYIFVQAILHLRSLSGEPGHPQEFAVVLMALSVLVAARNCRGEWRMIFLGSIAAALALTKINVGIFFIFALLQTMVIQSRSKLRPWCLWPIFLLGLCLPLALMRQHLAENWAIEYCLVVWVALVTSGAFGFLTATTDGMGSAQWLRAAVSFAVVATGVLILILLQGTTPRAMFDCLVLRSANLTSAFCIPLQANGGFWSAAGSLLVAAMVIVLRRHTYQVSVWLGLLKLVYGIIGAFVLLGDSASQLSLLLPWAWLALPGRESDPTQISRPAFPRLFLCLMTAWQALQAYPVAGTQVAVATFPMIVVCSLCLCDSATILRTSPWMRWYSLTAVYRTRLLFNAFVYLMILYVFVGGLCNPLELWQRFVSVPPLGLPGARYLRLKQDESQHFRELSQYVQTHCDTFLTIPGLNSLYFWTEAQAPTLLTINGEGVMPSARQQDLIVAALRRAKQPLIILGESRWGSEVRLSKPVGPLMDFVRDECRQVRTIGSYRILAPVKTATQGVPPDSTEQASGS